MLSLGDVVDEPCDNSWHGEQAFSSVDSRAETQAPRQPSGTHSVLSLTMMHMKDIMVQQACEQTDSARFTLAYCRHKCVNMGGQTFTFSN